MDKFTVLGFLGEGAFGTVMKCRDSINGQLFAVKKFVPLRRQEMSKTIAMEFTLLARLQHDNLIKVVSKFTEKSRLHCVFELMDHSICDDMEQQPQGLESLLLRKYTFQILCGMEYLHSVNVLHRDIKPSNLLVSRSGVVKVADLGLGRVLDANRGPSLTLSVGTLWFLSPEALTGGRFLSKSHDVWAIGCTVLAMAKSKAFIVGLTFLEQLLMVVSKVGHLTVQQQQGFLTEYPGCKLPAPALPPTDPQQKYRLCDPLLAQLVEACLQMDPDSRASCSELLGQRYFTWDSFHHRFSMELAEMVQADQHGASLTQPMDQPQTTDVPICPSTSTRKSESQVDGPCPPITDLLQDVLQVIEEQVGSVPDITGTSAHAHLISLLGNLSMEQDHRHSTKYPGCVLPGTELPPVDPQREDRLCDPPLAQLVEASLQMYHNSRGPCSELLANIFTCDSLQQRLSEDLVSAEEMVHADPHGPSTQPLFGSKGWLDPDTVGPHEASCSQAIPPDISPPDISQDITSEAESVKRKGRCGAGFLRAMQNIRGFFTTCCSPHRE